MKRKVFLDYTLPRIIAALMVTGVIAWLIADAFSSPKPDYVIGYVGSRRLSDESVHAISQALSAYGEDINGNGEVLVSLNQYLIQYDSTEADPYEQMAGISSLSVDLKELDFVCLIVENADRFIESCDTVLTLSGGKITLQTEITDVRLPFQASPVLTAVPLPAKDADILRECSIVITEEPGARTLMGGQTRTEADTRLFEAIMFPRE